MEERKRNTVRINVEKRKISNTILNIFNICKIVSYKINKFIKLRSKSISLI